MAHANPFKEDWSGHDQEGNGTDIADLMKFEDWTNGVWNLLISKIFTYKDGYLVIPEFRFNGGRADIAVVKYRQKTPQLVLVYEGKKSGGAIMTASGALQQALNCIKGTSAGSSPGIIIALGSKFRMTTVNQTPLTHFGPELPDKDGLRVLTNNNIGQVQKYLESLKQYNTTVKWTS